MKAVLVLPCSLAFGATLLAQGVERPNIIIFLVDDMGLMDSSVPFLCDEEGKPQTYPLNEWYRTPNMEKLAQQGVRFSTFYAQSVSSPSRTSILTGQNATRHRTTNWINARHNNHDTYGPRAWNWQGISKQTPTLPKVLRQAGYRTILVGKAHFSPLGGETEDPRAAGFDINIAGSALGEPGSYRGRLSYASKQGERGVPHLEKYHGSDTFLTDALTSEAKAQITEALQASQPFFLYLSHYAVHNPFELDERFSAHYTEGSKSAQARAFATLIEGVDKSLGELMDFLEEKGIAENTLILFLGDNGSDAPLGDAGDWASSAPLRGKKGSEYEGGVRVPFIASWGKRKPNHKAQRKLPISPGGIQRQLATVMDIYPTLLSVAGATPPERHPLDGFDLAPQLRGERNKKRSETFLLHFPHEHRGSYFSTYRDGAWKLIYYYHPEPGQSSRCVLYNLEVDPEERHDRSLHEPRRLKLMLRAMARQLRAEGALYPTDSTGKPVLPLED